VVARLGLEWSHPLNRRHALPMGVTFSDLMIEHSVGARLNRGS